MNAESKKTILRMIPYGIYILTADDAGENVAAATVNWVTQSAFAPPLVVVGVKADSGTYKTVKAAQAFALNMLGKEQKNLAFTFFRPVDVSDGKLNGQSFRKGGNRGAASYRCSRRGRVPCDGHCRAGRSSHRCRRGCRRASKQTAPRQAGHCNP